MLLLFVCCLGKYARKTKANTNEKWGRRRGMAESGRNKRKVRRKLKRTALIYTMCSAKQKRERERERSEKCP